MIICFLQIFGDYLLFSNDCSLFRVFRTLITRIDILGE